MVITLEQLWELMVHTVLLKETSQQRLIVTGQVIKEKQETKVMVLQVQMLL